MKTKGKTRGLLIWIWIIIPIGVIAQGNTEAYYFGQKPPGLIPEVFAPGIISLDGHTEASITFSPDMSELFFARRKSGESHNIYTMKWKDGKWSDPTLAPFSTTKEYLDFHPRLTPQGDRLYFGSNRPLNDDTDEKRLRLWYVDKTPQGWSRPIPMIDPGLENRFIMCATPSVNGNLYFTSKEKDDKVKDGGIYCAINQEGKYDKVQRLGVTINGAGEWIAHPYIAPDESYLIYDAERSTGDDNGDLYVSFQKNGIWSESYSLGPEINTKLGQGTATVSPDGKYLFFRSVLEGEETPNLYWISTAVIERLRLIDFQYDKASYEIAYAGLASGHGQVYVTDKAGKSKLQITNRAVNDGYPAWSPDGKRLAIYAYHDGRKTWSIHSMNRDGSNRKRLTHEQNKWDSAPAWSPDGRKIAHGRAYRDAEGVWRQEIWIMNADGSESKQLPALDGGGPAFSPDGRIVFHSSGVGEICIADQDGSNRKQLTSNEAEEYHPEVSPDGKEVVFMSNRDGNHEIYVMNIDGSNPRRLTFNEVRDSTPTWSPDGSQILFTSRESEEEKHLYLINRDGTGLSKFIEHAGAAAWLKRTQ